MRRIKLTQGQFALIDDIDFERISQYKWHAVKASNKHSWYANTNIWIKKDGKKIRYSLRMHRFLLNTPKGKVVDHINGNGLDNRRENIRICDQKNNVCNAIAHRNSISKYRGVSLQSGKWKVQIQINKKKIHLGYFDSEEEAAQVYNKAAKKYHGEFARLNKVEE